MNFEKYTITIDASIMDSLKKINLNKKGFLVVVNVNNKVIGTLTDGDIRRAFIQGKTIEEGIEQICTRKFRSLRKEDSIGTAMDMFKSQTVKFLPIVDEDNILCNIITKSQMHTLLLQDVRADLGFDFESLDENLVDYEIFQRPWGFYKTTVMNAYFQSKIISVSPKEQISLQSHNHREEHWIVAHGVGKVQLDQSVIDVHCGSSIYIPKGCKHRVTNTDEKESLIITEVQIGDYFGEDDIHRYEDIYGRV